MPATTASTRAHNFSAGPAALPEAVLEEARRDLWDIFGTGVGILEHSHRGGAFDRVIDEAVADCRALANIPDTHHVLFLQGGASTQFFQIPMSFLSKDKTADYLVTGGWAKKAAKEAKLYGSANIAASSEDRNFCYIPDAGSIKLTPGAAYCHYTSNNTLYGTQFTTPPNTDAPLICDASSDIFSKPIDVAKHALIYAGAQKNLGPAGCALVIVRDDLVQAGAADIPTMMQYRTHAEKGSRYNTPNTFAIYLMGRVFKWIANNGGLEGMASRNEEKASTLYDFLDASEFYTTTADADSRSRMNVCFRCANEDLEPAFIAQAESAGLKNLKGHRSVGGMRASIYNALSIDDVNALIDFMKHFERENG